MNKFIEMDYDEWFKTYKPIPNNIDKNASFGDDEHGYMFETYGDELKFVESQPEANIWMYGDGDNGGSFIWNGWGFVNRLGYFVTEVPCPPDTDIQILVSIDYYYCENCDEEWEDPDNTIRNAFGEADLQKCPKCATVEELELVKEAQMENETVVDPELLKDVFVDLRGN